MPESNFAASQVVTKSAVRGKFGVVAAQHRRVAEIGAEILEAGGDAVDSAVAASFAAGVLEPWMSGPLGGGAMLIWRQKTRCTQAIAFNPRSPYALNPNCYALDPERSFASDLFSWRAVIEDRNVHGPLSIATPGLVAGIALAHQHFGHMPWSTLLQPAIDVARAGPPLDWYASLLIASKARWLSIDPDAAAMFLDEGLWPKISGWTALSDRRLEMSAAASTLAYLAEAGPNDFYCGDIATTIVRDAVEKGAVLSRADMDCYSPVMSPSLACYSPGGGFNLVPGLTGGPTFVNARARLSSLGSAGPESQDPGYISYRSALLQAQAYRIATMGHAGESPLPDCTSHISVADRHGNMVSLTQTLLSVFGSCVVSPGTGFLFNNGIMWFDPEPGGPNSLSPGRTCLMNVCPVIGTSIRGRFALGASGGRKILPAVFQIASFLTDLGLSLGEAFSKPRIDPVNPSLTIVDPRLPAQTIAALCSTTQVRLVQPAVFPSIYASPTAIMQNQLGFEGCTDFMLPWADAVAPQSPGNTVM